MNLKGVSAKLSDSGSEILLIHQQSQETLQTLYLIPANPSHRNFILGTWTRSYRAEARKQGYGAFYDSHESAVAESRWSDCLVATDEDGYTVYGWVCGNRSGQLFHCYVVPELRRIRVASRLIDKACGEVTEYARRWPFNAHARINPYILGPKIDALSSDAAKNQDFLLTDAEAVPS